MKLSWLSLLLPPAFVMSAPAKGGSEQPPSDLSFVRMDDGVRIAVECAGRGETLLIVHGGTGSRTRWTPMFPLLASRLRVCAMDRRGHGKSGDSAKYNLQREARDVEEVAIALPGRVTVFGHSYGGIAALEAALHTHKIGRLILYEPPLEDGDHSVATAHIEQLLAEGQNEAAARTFLTDVVRVPREEVQQMEGRPSWSELVGSMGTVVRQDRALASYRWNPRRYRKLFAPTLLIAGGDTRSPQLKLAIADLQRTLPHSTTVVLAGQQHSAMDTDRPALAQAILSFIRDHRLRRGRAKLGS